MLKSALVSILLAGLVTTGTARAEEKSSTNAEAAPVSCTQESLAALNTKAAAATDADKKKTAMGHLDLAKKSMDAKDMDGCAMHLKEAANDLGAATK